MSEPQTDEVEKSSQIAESLSNISQTLHEKGAPDPKDVSFLLQFSPEQVRDSIFYKEPVRATLGNGLKIKPDITITAATQEEVDYAEKEVKLPPEVPEKEQVTFDTCMQIVKDFFNKPRVSDGFESHIRQRWEYETSLQKALYALDEANGSKIKDGYAATWKKLWDDNKYTTNARNTLMFAISNLSEMDGLTQDQIDHLGEIQGTIMSHKEEKKERESRENLQRIGQDSLMSATGAGVYSEDSQENEFDENRSDLTTEADLQVVVKAAKDTIDIFAA